MTTSIGSEVHIDIKQKIPCNLFKQSDGQKEIKHNFLLFKGQFHTTDEEIFIKMMVVIQGMADVQIELYKKCAKKVPNQVKNLRFVVILITLGILNSTVFNIGYYFFTQKSLISTNYKTKS